MKRELKLELKHLAPYLPYGLKLYTKGSGNEYIRTLAGLSDKGVSVYSKTDPVASDQKINLYKPILKPISNLDGGQLIELFEIAYKQVYKTVDETLNNFHFHGWDDDNFGLVVNDDTFTYGFSMDFEGQQDFRFSYKHINAEYPNSMLMINKLELFEKLIEWHFDVFNLIGLGLAIDATTLNYDAICY